MNRKQKHAGASKKTRSRSKKGSAMRGLLKLILVIALVTAVLLWLKHASAMAGNSAQTGSFPTSACSEPFMVCALSRVSHGELTVLRPLGESPISAQRCSTTLLVTRRRSAPSRTISAGCVATLSPWRRLTPSSWTPCARACRCQWTRSVIQPASQPARQLARQAAGPAGEAFSRRAALR